jgi:hypothetical protein
MLFFDSHRAKIHVRIDVVGILKTLEDLSSSTAVLSLQEGVGVQIGGIASSIWQRSH